MKCILCGANVEVVGNTTMHYRNLDKEKIERLTKALEFYADPDDWAEFQSDGSIFSDDVSGDFYSAFRRDLDNGYTAREALKEG